MSPVSDPEITPLDTDSTQPAADTWTSRELAVRIACLADEKRGEDVAVLAVGPAFQVTDYFVIASGQNKRHLAALAEHAAKELKQSGLYRIGGSSLHDQDWVLLDFGAVVFHAFSTEARGYYDLENLWGDCEKVDWRAEAAVYGIEPAPVADVPDVDDGLIDDDDDGESSLLHDSEEE